MIYLKKIKRAYTNKDIKQLIDNFFSLAALKIFNLILPFITLPYLIKTLGFKQYGAIVLALSLIQYFQAITDYGFNLSATRDIAKHRHSKQQLNYIYSKVMASKLILLLISLSLLLLIIFMTPQFRDDRLIFLLMLPVLIGHTLFPEWFFRGMEKMHYITTLDLSIKIFFTVGVFIFIHKPEDYWIYPLLNGTGYFLTAILAHTLIKKNFSINLILAKTKQIKKTLANSFPLFVNQFAPNLYNNTTSFVIGLSLGNYAVGIFGSVRKIVDLLSVFNAVTISVFFPYLNRNPKKFQKFSKLYIIFFMLLCLIFILFKDILFNLFNINNKDFNNTFFLLVSGIFCIAIYNVYSTCYLVRIKKDILVMRMVFFTSLFGLILSITLVQIFGITGGALSIFTTQLLLATISYIFYVKLSGERNDI